MLALRLVVVHVLDIDLRPHAARQQPFVVAGVLGRDVQVAVTEVDGLGPPLAVGDAYLHLVDEAVTPLVHDHALGLHRLVGPDVVLGKGVVDDLEAHLDRDRVRGGAVLAEQELEHEDRHVGADLDVADEVLADNLAGEGAIDLVVEGVSGRVCPSGDSKLHRDVGG